MKKILLLLFTASALNGISQQAMITLETANVACVGSTAVLNSSNSIPGSFPITNSLWSVLGPNSFIFSGNTAPGVSLSVQLPEVGFYAVNLINQHSNGTTSFTQSFNLIEANGPSVDPLTILDTGICSTFFKFSLDSMSNVASWSWDLGNGSTVSNLQEPDAQFDQYYSNFQDYNLKLTLNDGQGCAVSYYDTITYSLFSVQAAFSASSPGFQSGDLITFTDHSECNSQRAITQWVWSFGDGSPDTTLYTNQDVSHLYFNDLETSVNLIVWDDHGCIDDFTLTLNELSGIDPPNQNTDPLLYPNPTSAFLNIKALELSPMTVEILDLQGKQVDKQDYSVLQSQLDVSHLEKGIYLLKISNATESHRYRFQKI